MLNILFKKKPVVYSTKNYSSFMALMQNPIFASLKKLNLFILFFLEKFFLEYFFKKNYFFFQKNACFVLFLYTQIHFLLFGMLNFCLKLSFIYVTFLLVLLYRKFFFNKAVFFMCIVVNVWVFTIFALNVFYFVPPVFLIFLLLLYLSDTLTIILFIFKKKSFLFNKVI